MKTRCPWARNEFSIPYHDEEWGVPVHDDRTWFEFLILEGAQAGLSWDTPSPVGKLGNILLGGWGLDLRAMARSAFPLTLDGNYLLDPATQSRYYGNLDLVAGQPIYLHGSTYPGRRAVNPAAFAYPADNGAGDAPRNLVRGFGSTQINLAARRQIQATPKFLRITERRNRKSATCSRCSTTKSCLHSR